ncbi:GtrA family protein [Paraburkholderia aspalathi]|uniref:GtrA family protein n=1 Tax=Paraburkholderia aspalathi TaxID=1324617 RepID=UPI0038B972C6
MSADREVIARFFRYGVVGAAGTFVQYLILTGLVEGGPSFNPVLASTIGAIVGAGINYWLNYRFTFRSDRRHSSALPKFLTTATAGMAINAGLMDVLVIRLQVRYLLAQVIATVFLVGTTFIINSIWTFNHKND